MSVNNAKSGLVNFSIKIAGKAVDKNCPIFSITIEKIISKIPYAKIMLHDGDAAQRTFPVTNSKLFEIGQAIEIELGYQNALSLAFKGIITRQALKASNHVKPYLEIFCKDITYRTTLIPQTTSYTNMTDSEIFKKIIEKYDGLDKRLASTSFKYEALSQQDTTDWDFINIRSEANGQVVIVDDGVITTAKPDPNQSANYTFTYGTNIYALDLEMDAPSQWKQAEGKIWEPSSQKSKKVTASAVETPSFGAMSYNDLANVNSKQETITFYHSGVAKEEEMKNFATGLLGLNRLAKIRGSITIQGIADIKPGQTIKIEKGADNFQGTAYVSGVKHLIEDGEWLTELTIGLPNERYTRRYNDINGIPAAGMLCPIYGLQIGVVKKLVGDPLSAYRIFVNIPIIHEPNEGIWCRIASFYASKEIGAFFMPELEDEVVVGFINDDFRAPVIVGSLYSTKHTTPIQQDKENTIKTFVSRSKLEMTFNEQDKSILFKTPGGRTISLSDKTGTIEIVNGNANKVILGKQDVEIMSNQNIVLNAKKAITLQASENISIKATNAVDIAGMNFTAKANMKAAIMGTNCTELQSGATMIVKGSIVQIN